MSLQEYRSIEVQMKELEARRAKLAEEVEPRLAFVEKVKARAEEAGIDLVELALELAPNLVRVTRQPGATGTGRGKGTRQPRRVKVYTNPHTNETVETKGGNNKTLKEWKAEYGNDEVESWASFQE